jgi:iron complex outermembrane receptor protein/vitamin B12 transporter
MPVYLSLRRRARHILSVHILLLLLAATVCPAASIRGIVSDSTGARVTGASVSLLSGGQLVSSAVSGADGSFQITTGSASRFFLIVSATNFRQLQTPDFYAGQLDSLERNVVLEPAWVRDSIVVSATGTPTPGPQTGAAVNVLGPLDLAQSTDFVSILRLMPGVVVVQTGQRGAQTSLFVNGGDSDDNKVLVDGVDVGDLGNQFDFGQLSTTAIESAEVNRGPNSNLYGAGAETGVINFTTPHGTTSFPSLIFEGDAGSLRTSREQLELAGAHKKFDYLGEYSWLQSANNLPRDEYHIATSAANLGWQPNGNTLIRVTLHNGVNSTGVPNAWAYYYVADSATQKDRNIFLSGSLDNQTTPSFHNSFHYGLTRKREQYAQWAPEGYCIPVGTCGGPGIAPTYTGGNYFGNPLPIVGANGYSAKGPALLDYSWANGAVYPSKNQQVNNRDQYLYRGDYRITPHLMALIGFDYAKERGSTPGSTYYSPVMAKNYIYLASVHGDFKNRFYYTLGGSLMHYSLFGTQTPPHASVSYYILRPGKGTFSGTRILFNYGDSVREPKLTDEDGSLYAFLENNGGQSTLQQLHLARLAAPFERTYEGGVEQSFFNEHIVARISYYHNQFRREIEYVGLNLVPELLPNLTSAQQAQLESFLRSKNAYELTLNSEAYRGEGIETNVESGIGRNLFLRGGYTYLDAVVQQSFTNNDQALLGPIPTFNGIPVGPYSPLQGGRPFRRPKHTGFFSATYAAGKLSGAFSAALASRSDDSTYLEGDDVNGGNSLLIPNLDLDPGYAKLDLGGNYQLLTWLGVYAQAENLMDNQHIAPIGYLGLPITVRTGLRIQWGIGSGH